MQQIETASAHPCIEIWECNLPALRHIKITPTNYVMINALLNDLPALKDYLLSLPSEPSQADIDYENRNYSTSMSSLVHNHLRGVDVNTKPNVTKKKVVKSKSLINQPDLFDMA